MYLVWLLSSLNEMMSMKSAILEGSGRSVNISWIYESLFECRSLGRWGTQIKLLCSQEHFQTGKTWFKWTSEVDLKWKDGTEMSQKCNMRKAWARRWSQSWCPETLNLQIFPAPKGIPTPTTQTHALTHTHTHILNTLTHIQTGRFVLWSPFLISHAFCSPWGQRWGVTDSC